MGMEYNIFVIEKIIVEMLLWPQNNKYTGDIAVALKNE